MNLGKHCINNEYVTLMYLKNDLQPLFFKDTHPSSRERTVPPLEVVNFRVTDSGMSRFKMRENN